MAASLSQSRSKEHKRGGIAPTLPPKLRILLITARNRSGGWLAEALAAEAPSQAVLQEAVGEADGMARLRDEPYDLVLVSHEPGELDALRLVQGCRLSGADEPMIVLGNHSEQEMAAEVFEAGADGYLCVQTATTANLLWLAARAVNHHQLKTENQRLGQAEQTRLQREHDEATRVLAEQRAMLAEVPPAAEAELVASHPFPPALVTHYRELLRIYVIMGSGNLACELSRLGKLLVDAEFTARQTMQLHVEALEELIHGLGARSTRHVMTRADLLALELLTHLAEGYHRRYQEQVNPPRQKLLPGFMP